MPSVVAEAIIASLNQSMDSWDQSSAATFVEQKVVDWMCEKYELGAQADGIFTSGGTQSNQMGLMLARDWIADKLSGHSIQKLVCLSTLTSCVLYARRNLTSRYKIGVLDGAR